MKFLILLALLLYGTAHGQTIHQIKADCLKIQDGLCIDKLELGYLDGVSSSLANVVRHDSSSVDNTLVRWDSTTGKVAQESSVVLSDAEAMSGITQLDVDNVRVDGNTVSITQSNGALNLTSNGTGATVLSRTTVGGSVSYSVADTWSASILGMNGGPIGDMGSFGQYVGWNTNRITATTNFKLLGLNSYTNGSFIEQVTGGLAYKTVQGKLADGTAFASTEFARRFFVDMDGNAAVNLASGTPAQQFVVADAASSGEEGIRITNSEGSAEILTDGDGLILQTIADNGGITLDMHGTGGLTAGQSRTGAVDHTFQGRNVVTQTDSTSNSLVSIQQTGGTSTSDAIPTFQASRWRGGWASRTANQNGDIFGQFAFNSGYDSSSSRTNILLRAITNENHGASNGGADLYFYSIPAGSTTLTERARLSNIQTAPGVAHAKTCYYAFGGGSATLAAPTECTTGTCVEVIDSCSAGTAPTWATVAEYENLTFAAGTWANSSFLDCSCVGYDTTTATKRPCDMVFKTGDQTWSTTAGGGAVLNMSLDGTGYVVVKCTAAQP